MSSLGNREKQLLLEVARRAVTRAAEFHEALANLPSDEILQRPGGAFVTLRRLDGTWRVAGIVLHTTYEQGDRALTGQASARAAADPGSRARQMS